MSNKTLVIVESPAKCKKIQGFLGPGYIVKASFGHRLILSMIISFSLTLINLGSRHYQPVLVRQDIMNHK